jgi:hypothetical protein
MVPITVCAKNCKAGGGCGPIDAQPEYSHCN